MRKILSVIILITLVWGCAKKITPAASQAPSSSNQSVPGVDNSGKVTENTNSSPTISQVPAVTSPETVAVNDGQLTYNAKCGRCHALKVTTDYTAERWASILVVMAPRANLTETEKANVHAYVKENAKK